MSDIDINDIRTSKDFKGISFSKFKKSEVRKELLNCINNNKIESACNWGAELICAGHYQELWEIILLTISKYIHLGNPKLPIYISMRFDSFKEVYTNGYVGNEISMRNNARIRSLFAEVIAILCLSNKKPALEAIKIKKTEEFSLTHMSNKLKAPTVNYGNIVFKKGDPKELYVAINELSYHIDRENSLYYCCYWVEWILEFEKQLRKNKDKIFCERRTFAPVQSKYQDDVIWIVWELLIIKCGDNAIKKKCVNALLDLFSLRYTAAKKKARKYMLYFALELIIEKVSFNTDIMSNKSNTTVKHVCKNIDNIYKKIKKNEEAPQTEYLFDNKIAPKKSNLEKTIEKLDMMSNFTGYIPRG